MNLIAFKPFAFALVTLFSAVSFGNTRAIANTTKILTPRGAEVEVTVELAPSRTGRTLIVAPGQSCNSKGPLFEAIGRLGPVADFTVVRFEWAYCLKDPKNSVPSQDLKNEIEDYQTVLAYAKTLPGVDAGAITLAGKSLGSMVAYSVFHSTPTAKALVLLTPICTYTTDDNGNSIPEPLRVCEQSYPGLKSDARPVFMTMGQKDDLCLLNVLFDYLKDSVGNIQVSVAGGDHGFRIQKADGTLDDQKTARNIEAVVNGLFNWADLNY